MLIITSVFLAFTQFLSNNSLDLLLYGTLQCRHLGQQKRSKGSGLQFFTSIDIMVKLGTQGAMSRLDELVTISNRTVQTIVIQ